mgnify:CR=1 FL=1
MVGAHHGAAPASMGCDPQRGRRRGVHLLDAPAGAAGPAGQLPDLRHATGQARRSAHREGRAAVLVRPDAARPALRPARQVALHGHATGAEICRRRRCRHTGRRGGDDRPAHGAEPGHAHRGGEGRHFSAAGRGHRQRRCGRAPYRGCQCPRRGLGGAPARQRRGRHRAQGPGAGRAVCARGACRAGRTGFCPHAGRRHADQRRASAPAAAQRGHPGTAAGRHCVAAVRRGRGPGGPSGRAGHARPAADDAGRSVFGVGAGRGA